MNTKLLSALLILVFALAGCSENKDETRPNIILIITDDQGYGDIGYNGNPDIKTPFLDSLAHSGIIMNQFYASPVCAPTRSELMSGRHALRTGVFDTYTGGAIMKTEEVTIAEILRDHGYRTGIFGKWHLGDNYPFRPSDQGFEETYIHKGGGIGQPGDHPDNYWTPAADSTYFDPVLFRNGKEVRTSGYCSDLFTEEAMKFIDRSVDNKKEPFFLYLAFNAPHEPLQVPQEYYDMYADLQISPSNYELPHNFPEIDEYLNEKARRVYAMVTNIDDNIAKLMGQVEQSGISENTMVIFMGDNGPQHYRYNGGLRGKKGSAYEGGIRVPCFMHYPELFQNGVAINSIAANVDILPTLLDICDIDIPEHLQLDGKSLVPALEGKEVAEDDRTLFYHFVRGYIEPYRNITIRRGQYKLVGGRGTVNRSGLELYDIYEDPYELNDISEANPVITGELADALDAWYQEVIHGSSLTDPPRIIIGSEHENPVTLTRQDWRGSLARIWDSPEAMGYWDITFAREGLYDVKVIFHPNDLRGTIHIRAGTIERRIDNNEADATEFLFKSTPLRNGDYTFEAWCAKGRKTCSPIYVEFNYLN